MSTLLLARHGQAHAFEADSDRLTERGAEQARRLGEYLVESGQEIDEVHTGTLVRQKRTAAIVGEIFRAAGKHWPQPMESRGWDEYAADRITSSLLPELARRDPDFARLVSEFQAAAGRPDRNRSFQRMFEVLLDHWQRGTIDSEGVEPFTTFHGRVRAVLSSIVSAASTVSGGRRRRVAVFTSGGPIGVSVQEVLEAPAKTALRLNWRIRNASLTEMIFSEGRVSLEYFNTVGFLPPELRTFR